MQVTRSLIVKKTCAQMASCFSRNRLCSTSMSITNEKPSSCEIPIYLGMSTTCFRDNKCIAYPPIAIYMIKEKPSSSKVPVFYDNVSATIRRLPNLSLRDLGGFCNLAAVNSKLLAIGGYHDRFAMIDLTNDDEAEWKFVSLMYKNKKLSISDSLVEEDGCMYVRSLPDMKIQVIQRMRHDVDGRIFIQQVYSSSKKKFWCDLIRVTNNRIYIGERENIYCYDSESKKHGSFANICDAHGNFVKRPLLLDDERYLCVYNYSEKRMTKKSRFKYKHIPGIHIYDTKLRKWVSGAVQGLPNDGLILPPATFSPEPLEKHGAHDDGVFVLRIGTHQGSPILALVWSSDLGYLNDNCLHFCKFILHVLEEEEEGESYPIFKAEILSYGRNQLDNQVGQVRACTARVMMTDEGAYNTVSRLANDSLPWEEVTIEEDPPERFA